MYAVLLSTALLNPQDPAAPPAAGADRPAADRLGAAGNVSLDGNWTVISLEKNGQPVPNAANMTVMVKGNTVTFDAGKATGGAAGDANQMRAMRLDFGRNGQLYVTEANAEGKFDTTGTDRRDPGTGRPGSGTNPRDNGTAPPAGARPGDNTKFPTPPGSAAGIPAGSKSGVYVLTQDYFAVCIHDEGMRTGSPGTDRPNADRPGGAGGDRPAAGTTGNDRPGQPAAAGGAAAGADRGSLSGGLTPQSKSYCTVILKRAGGAGQPGTPGSTPNK